VVELPALEPPVPLEPPVVPALPPLPEGVSEPLLQATTRKSELAATSAKDENRWRDKGTFTRAKTRLEDTARRQRAHPMQKSFSGERNVMNARGVREISPLQRHALNSAS
jgi:hypothetical protein